jgi:hypothetical protein
MPMPRIRRVAARAPLHVTFALVVSAMLAALPAGAQDHRLTDADLPRMLPILNAQLQEMRQLSGTLSHLEDLTAPADRAREAIRSGMDPEVWYRQNVPSFTPPPGAVYDAACSRQLGEAQVVYTLGEGEKLAGWTPEVQAHYERYRRDLYPRGDVTPEADQNLRMMALRATYLRTVETGKDGQLIRRAADFYRERGYTFTGPGTHTWLSPDKLHDVASHDQLYLAIECPHLGNRPVAIVKYVGAAYLAKDLTAPTHGSEAAIARSGWPRSRWDAVFGALMMARANAADPSLLEVLATANPGDADLLRANTAWYRRHTRELEPLMAELMRLMP